MIPKAERTRLPYNHPALDDFALRAEQQYGLPPGMILALKNAGERSNTVKSDGSMNRSYRADGTYIGAQGVMQFIDETRQAYPHDPSDPLESIDASARYMADLLRQYKGNPMAAIAHYNGGSRQANAVLRGEQPPANETRMYLARVRRFLDSSPVASR